MYLSYFILYFGYVLNNQTITNLVLFVIAVMFQLLRMRSEENLLSQNPEYREYQKKTPWKFIPGVY
jgi:protein-S-isoprenylcysteine O-methyltransferase Ste14